jgi:hypothetical protein
MQGITPSTEATSLHARDFFPPKLLIKNSWDELTMAMTALPLDHLVINTRFETTRAAALFARLGFTLTPRGHHAMGSVNHLVVFENDYLELIGLPEEGGVLRQEVLENPAGIDGLVFQTGNADAVHATLTAQGEKLQPLHAFSRPVEIDGCTFDAAFRVTRFQSGQFDAGRVYFCQHLTPELIWRAPWQRHANTALSLAGLLLVSEEAAVDAGRYAAIAQGEVTMLPDGAYRIEGARYHITVMEPALYTARYGALACDSLGRSSFFGAIAIRLRDPTVLIAAIHNAGDAVAQRHVGNRIQVQLKGFNALLEFVGDDNAFR